MHVAVIKCTAWTWNLLAGNWTVYSPRTPTHSCLWSIRNSQQFEQHFPDMRAGDFKLWLGRLFGMIFTSGAFIKRLSFTSHYPDGPWEPLPHLEIDNKVVFSNRKKINDFYIGQIWPNPLPCSCRSALPPRTGVLTPSCMSVSLFPGYKHSP